MAQETIVLRDGLPVRLRLTRNLSSAAIHAGESADFEVLEDVKVNDTLVIAKGAEASGTVSVLPSKGKKSAVVAVSPISVRMINDEKASLRSSPEMNTAAPGLTGATLPQDTQVTAYVAGDVTFDPARLPAPPMPQTATETAPAEPLFAPPVEPGPSRAMTNRDVMALKAAGVSDDLVIVKIKNGPGNYQLTPGDLIALRQADVSDPVIQAMMSAQSAAAAPSEAHPAAGETPRKGLLGKLKVAILGAPDAWSSKAAVHPAAVPEQPAGDVPPQLALCPVTILSQPADAAILVDGYPAGRTPAVVKLQPGTYKVTLQAPGFPAYTQQIIVQAGQVRSFGVALESSK